MFLLSLFCAQIVIDLILIGWICTALGRIAFWQQRLNSVTTYAALPNKPSSSGDHNLDWLGAHPDDF